MSKITKKQVLHIAKLAKLKLSSQEVEKYKKQLSGIIEYVENLSELDTKGAKPTGQTTSLLNVYREDKIEIESILSQKNALSGIENTYNGYFKVGRVLKRNDKQ